MVSPANTAPARKKIPIHPIHTGKKEAKFRGFSHINLFSLQYIGTLRAKRVRTMVIMITAIFLFDAYLFALMPLEPGQEMGDKVAMTTLDVAGAILLP